VPVRAFLEAQGRFRHLLADEEAVAEIQRWVDTHWQKLQGRVSREREQTPGA
jgi:pyruvate/2-oxoacid:ferredoxin oxidoreductase beta subunit